MQNGDTCEHPVYNVEDASICRCNWQKLSLIASCTNVGLQVNEPIYIPAIDGYSNLRIGETPGLMLRAVYSPPKRWTHAEALSLTVRDFALIRKVRLLAILIAMSCVLQICNAFI